MNQNLWIMVGVVVIVIAAVAWAVVATMRTKRLRRRFGPEYSRAIEKEGDRRQAEKVLEMRERRIEQLHIHPLTEAEYGKFKDAWAADQAKFVDDPPAAVTDADRLIGELMTARGYPAGDFEQRAADLSVEYPHLVEKYRTAHQIALRQERGEASTEELRSVMVLYRELFEALLESEVGVRDMPKRAAAGR
jgi:hypothetical protein